MTDHSGRSSCDPGSTADGPAARHSAPRGLPDTAARLRQRHLMGKVGTARSFQVRPLQQLPGWPQAKEQLSSSPRAPQEGFAPLPFPAAPELGGAGTEQPGPSALWHRGKRRRNRSREAARRLLPSHPEPRRWNNRMAPPPAGRLSSSPQGARRKCSGAAAPRRELPPPVCLLLLRLAPLPRSRERPTRRPI